MLLLLCHKTSQIKMVTASSPGEPCHDGLISVTLEQMKEELELAQPPPSAVTEQREIEALLSLV